MIVTSNFIWWTNKCKVTMTQTIRAGGLVLLLGREQQPRDEGQQPQLDEEGGHDGRAEVAVVAPPAAGGHGEDGVGFCEHYVCLFWPLLGK